MLSAHASKNRVTVLPRSEEMTQKSQWTLMAPDVAAMFVRAWDLARQTGA
jgi:hypothetical protein